MPYAVPSPTSPVASSSLTTATTRPTHRRSRSSNATFNTEPVGPGAFAPLASIPRRRPSSTKKAVFHLNPDDDSPQEDSSYSPANTANGNTNGNSLRLSIDNGRFSPSISPPSHIDIPPSTPPASVPFPTSSPVHSPLFAPSNRSPFIPPPSPPHTNSLPRTPSSPVVLSNGRPLKSSLKFSSSSPNIPADFQRAKHLRAQSAPSTPNVHKNVHFMEKDSGLESVKLFKRSGKPASLSKPSGDDTETETEAENISTSVSSFPFPSLSPSSSSSSSASSSPPQPLLHEIDPASSCTSQIPRSNPPLFANVHLETITLPRTRPPTLRGTVLVRNLGFEKNVAVRFTLDDWQTTSEVLCKHVVSLPGLPPPFPRPKKKMVPTVRVEGENGESASVELQEEEEDRNEPTWDRFSFTIRLEDYEAKLADRILWLVARFQCPPSYNSPGGEWWDNNDGNNYRIGFRRATVSPLSTPISSSLSLSSFLPASSPSQNKLVNGVPARLLASGLSQQRTFSAPSSLRYTPMTGALAGVPITNRTPFSSSPSASNGVGAPAGAIMVPTTVEGRLTATPALVRSFSSPYPSSPSQTQQPSPQPFSTESQQQRASASPPGPSSYQSCPQSIPVPIPPKPSPPSPSATHTSSYIRRRLSLSNYVAPGSSPTSPTSLCGAIDSLEATISSCASEEVKEEVVGQDEKTTRERESGILSLATPPSTPPGTVRLRSSSLPVEAEGVLSNPNTASVSSATNLGEDQDEVEEIEQVDEDEDEDEVLTPQEAKRESQPHAVVGGDTVAPPSSTPVQRVFAPAPAIITTTNFTTNPIAPSLSTYSSTYYPYGSSMSGKDAEEMPFSPTSSSRAIRPFASMRFDGVEISASIYGHGSLGGLISPPRSRDTSEDGSGEGGRSSPSIPPEQTEYLGYPDRNRPSFPTLGLTFSNSNSSQSSSLSSSPSTITSSSSHNSSPSTLIPPPPSNNNDDTYTSTTPPLTTPTSPRVEPTDSSYAAFVRQWCFAQSTPPTPGVMNGRTPSLSLLSSPGHTPSPTGTGTGTPNAGVINARRGLSGGSGGSSSGLVGGNGAGVGGWVGDLNHSVGSGSHGGLNNNNNNNHAGLNNRGGHDNHGSHGMGMGSLGLAGFGFGLGSIGGVRNGHGHDGGMGMVAGGAHTR